MSRTVAEILADVAADEAAATAAAPTHRTDHPLRCIKGDERYLCAACQHNGRFTARVPPDRVLQRCADVRQLAEMVAAQHIAGTSACADLIAAEDERGALKAEVERLRGTDTVAQLLAEPAPFSVADFRGVLDERDALKADRDAWKKVAHDLLVGDVDVRESLEVAVWVNVEDALPPLGAPVECRFPRLYRGDTTDGYLPDCFYNGHWRDVSGRELLTPTHWRLLPVKGERAAAAFVAAVSAPADMAGLARRGGE